MPEETGLLDVVRTTVSRNPNVALQTQQAELSKGALQQASGQFDETLALSLNRQRVDNALISPSMFSPPDLTEDITAYTLSLSRELRSGIILSPSLSVTRTNALSSAAIYNLGQVNNENQGSFSFSVTVPILKGFGEDVAAAAETAAKSSYEADKLLLNHTIAQNVFNAVQAYWAWVAAVKSLAIYEESEQMARSLLDITRKLIEHTSIIDLGEANLSSKRSARISAEKAVSSARKALGEVMGLHAYGIAKLGSPAENELPQESGLRIPRQDQDRYFIDFALAHRTDLKSLQSRQEAAETGMIAAKKNVLPQLNLNLQAGYNSVSERHSFGDYFTAFGNNMSGLNTTVSLIYMWPVRNNNALGFYAQQKAAYEQAVINTTNSANTISAEVSDALNSLRKTSLQLTEARASVLSYRKAVESEKRKFTLGMSTLNDVITNENSLVTALLDEVSSLQNLEVGIITLRYQTGAIILFGADVFTIGVRDLTTVPETGY
ncbi:MAG: TolC family protein [Dissulfurispiraceae bacterium]